VIVAARSFVPTLEACLKSLAAQQRPAPEVLVVDGTADGQLAVYAERLLPAAIHLPVPGGNLPALKAAAIRRASGDFIAVLDPSDAAEPDWTAEIVRAFEDPTVTAVGGSVTLAGSAAAGNVAAYLFEYGAFSPPLAAGDAPGDLPGNNVAYRRSALLETCADILAAEGFNKPFFHKRIREAGGRLVLVPSLRVRHLTSYRLGAFGARRFHYGRCFGSVRARRAAPLQAAKYRLFAPLVPGLLVTRHLIRAAQHPSNRKLLPGAALALCAVCACWGVGEWLGYWFGPARSCEELY
jgi:GT2 family glycosyltransferase